MTATTTYTAIYQVGYAILGVGRDLDEAIADANRYCEFPITADSLADDDRVIGSTCEISITQALYDAVRERGGNLPIADEERHLYDLDNETHS